MKLPLSLRQRWSHCIVFVEKKNCHNLIKTNSDFVIVININLLQSYKLKSYFQLKVVVNSIIFILVAHKKLANLTLYNYNNEINVLSGDLPVADRLSGKNRREFVQGELVIPLFQIPSFNWDFTKADLNFVECKTVGWAESDVSGIEQQYPILLDCIRRFKKSCKF